MSFLASSSFSVLNNMSALVKNHNPRSTDITAAMADKFNFPVKLKAGNKLKGMRKNV